MKEFNNVSNLTLHIIQNCLMGRRKCGSILEINGYQINFLHQEAECECQVFNGVHRRATYSVYCFNIG